MAVLALDVSTKTGWATYDTGTRQLVSGVQEFKLAKGESAGMRTIRFRAWLRGMLNDLDPELVAYERPSFFRGAGATELIVTFLSVVQEECALRKTTMATIDTSKLKAHATGWGNAKKPAMVAVARSRWNIYGRLLGDDEADALCVLSWSLEDIGAEKPHFHRTVVIVRVRPKKPKKKAKHGKAKK